MSQDQIEILKNNLNSVQAQFDAAKQMINESMETSHQLRTKLIMTGQSLMVALKDSDDLKMLVEKKNAFIQDLTKEIDILKSQPITEDNVILD